VGEVNPKAAFFAFLGYLSTVMRTAQMKQFYPQNNGTDGKPRL